MDKYYYLIAQLPMLFFEKPALMGIEAFLEEAAKWLSRRDNQQLVKIQYDDIFRPSKGQRSLRKVKTFESALRNDLALWRRSMKEGGDYKPSQTPPSAREGNPLEVEKKLLRLRWDFITELEKDHHFDFDTVALYYLKLQILGRLFRFEKEKGRERYGQFIEGAIEAYASRLAGIGDETQEPVSE